MPKLPLPPADLADIGIRDSEMRTVSSAALWWRLHRVRGRHTTPWNQLRYYGPIDARFEPQNPPPGIHTERGVWYAAATPRTSFAEVFQRTRSIRLDPANYLTAARLARDVRLLDITGEPERGAWATRAGASMALATGRHDYTSAWARAICTAFPDLDGLVYHAALDGGTAIALFHPARDAMPTSPITSRPLADPALAPRLAKVCDEIGYHLV